MASSTWSPEKIRAFRKAQGWTQQELAERMGTALSTINAWEQGRQGKGGQLSRSMRLLLDLLAEKHGWTEEPNLGAGDDPTPAGVSVN
jgi:transcriptional regulator with XRE-family HTH domain